MIPHTTPLIDPPVSRAADCRRRHWTDRDGIAAALDIALLVVGEHKARLSGLPSYWVADASYHQLERLRDAFRSDVELDFVLPGIVEDMKDALERYRREC